MENNIKDISKLQSIESTSRRKAVKTIVGGVTALAAYNMLPTKWGVPVIEQVFLPAHAATSGTVVGTITVSAVPSGVTCQPTSIGVTVTGTVSTPDGRDLTGVIINIRYVDVPATTFATASATVVAGNTYSYTGDFLPTSGGWSAPDYSIETTFADQATYGTASATATGRCTLVGEP